MNDLLVIPSGGLLLVGICILLRRQARSREKWRRERAYLRAIIEAMVDGLYATDEKGRITLINSAACRMLGRAREEVVRRMARELLHSSVPRDFPLPQEWVPFEKVRRGEIFTGEQTFRTAGGSFFQVDVAIAPLRDGVGAVIGAVTVFRDITERKKREFALKRQATTDTLTGLTNRRRFYEQLARELARFKRISSPTALLMLDLDRFKQINDTFGHIVGDEVLKRFAEVARGSLRSVDLIGRLGGEEFAILLPGTDSEGACLFAERLRRAVAEIVFVDPAGSLTVTVSIGITLFTPADAAPDAPLSRADRALYRAKENGRNRVELDGQSSHEILVVRRR